IGLSTLLFAFSRHIRRWTFRHSDDPALHSARADRIGIILLGPVAVYIGYFGAGASIMLLAILTLGRNTDYRTVNALKNLVGGLMALVAIAIFIVGDMVAWRYTIAMCVGGIVGGWIGGRLVHAIPAEVVRWTVILVGCTITAIYGHRYWFAG